MHNLDDILIKKKRIAFVSDRLIIKTLYPEDVTEEYVQGLNDPELNQFLVARLSQHTSETVKAYVQLNLEANDKIFFGIFLKDGGNFIGTFRITLQPYHFIAGIGIFIFSRLASRKGFALETINRGAEFIFQDLGFRCIEAQVHCDNIQSFRMCQKAGFEVQSRICNKYRHEGLFIDIFSLNRYNGAFDDALIK